MASCRRLRSGGARKIARQHRQVAYAEDLPPEAVNERALRAARIRARSSCPCHREAPLRQRRLQHGLHETTGARNDFLALITARSSQRHRAQPHYRALRASERRTGCSSSATGGVYNNSLDGRSSTANGRAGGMLGYDPRRVPASQSRDLYFEASDRDGFIASISRRRLRSVEICCAEDGADLAAGEVLSRAVRASSRSSKGR